LASIAVLAATPAAGANAAAPVASFLWFPSSPMVGETVSLVSTSIDPSSPITAFAWNVTESGAFEAGDAQASATFTVPGAHVVQLRVTNAEGASSTVPETIQVSTPTATLMEPFPIVRFVASAAGTRTRLQLLSVEAPVGAQITIDCRGRGCPLKAETQNVTSTGVGNVTLSFSRFERRLHAGVILEIRVSKSGEIGDYTRLVIRGSRPPTREDQCLSPAGFAPILCPA